MSKTYTPTEISEIVAAQSLLRDWAILNGFDTSKLISPKELNALLASTNALHAVR